jgi:dienelactone hydrolase
VRRVVSVRSGEVLIQAEDAELVAALALPDDGRGVVLFAHGSGSGRHSPRNRYVAEVLNKAGFATVLADLLTPEEERVDLHTGRLRFDIGLLATRVTSLVDWATATPPVAALPAGLFGASTGAAAGLVAAAGRPDAVRAVVSRGGRPDLAGDALERVRAPTLLIVGGRDEVVLDLNRQAYERLRSEKRLEVVPGATHLFEEPGTLEKVAELAAAWFGDHLVRSASPASRR